MIRAAMGFVVDETEAVSAAEHCVLWMWGLSEQHPLARELVLVGRLQRVLGVTVDGLVGPRTLAMVRLYRPSLGPELTRILCFHALR